jgi:invasion protein IalB
MKSAETFKFAAGLRLTGELPVVGTDGVFHRNLIRDDGAAIPGLPSRRRHCRINPMFEPTLPRGNTGRMTRTGPSKDQPSRAAGRGGRALGDRLGLSGRFAPGGVAIGVFLTFFLSFFLGLTASASAQGAVRSVHGDWQIRCDTPPGAQTEQCALIQSVVAEDRSNAGLTVIVLKTADQKSKLMRVVAPLGVLLPSGLGLKLDNVDVGRAGFVRCLPNGCVAEVVMDDKLLGQLRSAKTATFIIFETPEEGIGFPLSLNGLGEGYDKLP